MCFHTSQTKKVKTLEKRFGVKISDAALVDYFDKSQYHLNGFAHPNMLVIPQQKSEVLAPGVWGIVPENKNKDEITSYYKEAVKFGGGLNARSEKAFQHFVYKNAILEKRCIIPVSGFFEPHEYKGKKYPYHFKNEDDSPMALAGLYSVIDTFITFTILTKEASPLFAKIHNKKKRQPLLLDEEQTRNWLATDTTLAQVKDILSFNYPEFNTLF
ncbi:SOS response-associated peptidase family protein [uncultured Formosa sp.]|uniref:SOS response-associated peptidase n=1 Tax=uncultured Formosa sp. TaxID=255435 RepID=UPI002627EC44|nr:SOS response-associated peptidase family protein [uncultured Formosa sp.]